MPRVSQYRLLPQQASNGDSFEPMDLDIIEPDDRDEPVILDDVSLDLESYISHYHGLPRIYRLEFIATHCKSLRVEALNMAINYIKDNTLNVRDYQRLFRKLKEAKEENRAFYPDADTCVPDSDWIDRKSKQAGLRFERLDNDLKNFHSNSMKENIRRGQDDLGDHYLDCGDLENAFKAYQKSRDHATTHKNQVNQCLNMIGVSILLRRWAHVQTHILRAESQPASDSPTTNPAIATKLHCAAGLFELNSRRYKKAAKQFLSTNFDHFTQVCTTPASSATNNRTSSSGSAGPSTSGGAPPIRHSWLSGSAAQPAGTNRELLGSAGQWEILAPINIAVYGSLCALATYSRHELSTHLINSASFKQFAELEPQIREAVAKFYESKYAACLSILQEIKNVLLLDMYLAPHVERLYRAIRSKALVQYFEPYSTASIHKMARAFDTTVTDLESEITPLIHEGHLKARIDSVNKILYAKKTDSRIQTYEKALKFGKLWQRQAEALIIRTAFLNANLETSNPSTISNSNAPDKTS